LHHKEIHISDRKSRSKEQTGTERNRQEQTGTDRNRQEQTGTDRNRQEQTGIDRIMYLIIENYCIIKKFIPQIGNL
jgi:hypothetical protein